MLKIRKWLLLFLLFLLIEIIQISVLSRLVIFGVRPDLCFLFTIVLSFRYGEKKGALIGLCAGLANDIAFIDVFGVAVFTYVISGYLFGLLKNRYYQEGIIFQVAFVFVACLLQGMLQYVVYVFLDGYRAFGPVILGIIIPASIITTAFTPLATVFGKYFDKLLIADVWKI